MGKKIVLSADGATATVTEAKISDAFTTLIDSDEAVTGVEKYLQLGAVGLGTALFMNKRHTGSYTNFGQ